MPVTTAKLTNVAEVGGVLKQVQQAFTTYQVARNQFINAVQGLLDRPDPGNITLEALMKNDVIAVLCCPLVQDPVPGIQSGALGCLGQLAGADVAVSSAVVQCGVLDSLILSMQHESAPVQRNANVALQALAGGGEEFGDAIIDKGVLPCLVQQLQVSGPPVKEQAVKTFDALIRGSEPHASLICDDALLTSLVAMLQSHDTNKEVARAIVSTLSTCAAHNPVLAGLVVSNGALPPLVSIIQTPGSPAELRAAALNCLSQIAKHDADLALCVSDTGVVPAAVQALTDALFPKVRHNAAAALLELVRKTPALAVTVTEGGAPACLARYLQLEKGGAGCLAGLVIVGQMAGYKSVLAKALVDADAGKEVITCVKHEDAGISGAAAWALEQLSQHGPSTSETLVAQGGLLALIDCYSAVPPSSSSAGSAPDLGPKASARQDQRVKLKAAIKMMIRNCNRSAPLEVFVVESSPPEVLKLVLAQLQPLLASDAKARQQYVTSGALMRMQQLEGTLDGAGHELVTAVNELFPPDVVNYYRG